jgi:hypothetical protein
MPNMASRKKQQQQNNMNKILTLSLLLIFGSCQQQSQPDAIATKKGITYFKDTQTGICFGAINIESSSGYLTTSITCVPCDSLIRYNYPIK